MSALQDLATDPQLKSNVLTTTQSIAEATQTLAQMTKDLRTITGNAQTQAQMRDTIANLDAAIQKANSLLGELGGTSSVYGVDAGATPAPNILPASSPYPLPAASPQGAPQAKGMTPQEHAKLQSALGKAVHNLIAIQFRLSGLSPQQNPGLNPVLTKSQGPLGDINLVVLPHSSTSFVVGANSIGNNTTWNAVIVKGSEHGFRIGGGVLYSQIGMLAQMNALKGFGLETRIYDLTYPMIDLYGNLRFGNNAELFFGQRDMTHASRRNTFGFQYTF